MHKLIFALVMSMLALPVLAEDSGPVAFSTSLRMVLGVDGKPRALEADERLPELLREQLVRQIGDWRFESVDGQPIPGEVVTWVHLDVCLKPNPQDPDALNMAVSFGRLGPKMEPGVFPRYPKGAARGGHTADLKVDYLVRPDGRISLERIESQRDRQPYRHEFESSVRAWLAELRFVPEQLDGQAIATRMSMPIRFSLGGGSATKETRQAMDSDECAAAAGKGLDNEAVVLEPRIRRVPERS
jgi:hypothetical protein